jgi:hypothetical protein
VQRRITRSKTVAGQRDALLGEYKHLLSTTGRLLPRLQAVAVPEARLRRVRAAAVSAWRRNQKRLERRRDALDGVTTYAELLKAAAVRTRTLSEHDSQRLNRRLIELSPSTCALDAAATGPVITLHPPAGATGNGERPEVSPAVTTPTDVSPVPPVTATAPPKKPADVSPGGAGAGGED